MQKLILLPVLSWMKYWVDWVKVLTCHKFFDLLVLNNLSMVNMGVKLKGFPFCLIGPS